MDYAPAVSFPKRDQHRLSWRPDLIAQAAEENPEATNQKLAEQFS